MDDSITITIEREEAVRMRGDLGLACQAILTAARAASAAAVALGEAGELDAANARKAEAVRLSDLSTSVGEVRELFRTARQYTVKISAYVRCEAEVEVEAEDEHEANALALEEALSASWEVKDADDTRGGIDIDETTDEGPV